MKRPYFPLVGHRYLSSCLSVACLRVSSFAVEPKRFQFASSFSAVNFLLSISMDDAKCDCVWLDDWLCVCVAPVQVLSIWPSFAVAHIGRWILIGEFTVAISRMSAGDFDFRTQDFNSFSPDNHWRNTSIFFRSPIEDFPKRNTLMTLQHSHGHTPTGGIVTSFRFR